MSISKKFCGGAVLAGLVLTGTPTDAAPLIAPNISGSVGFTRPGIKTESGTFGTISLDDPIWGTANLTINGAPSPNIMADASSSALATAQTVARALGSLEYAFEILGPAGEVPVLVSVLGSASGIADAGASFAVESSWSLASLTGILASDSINSGQMSGAFSDAFGLTYGLFLKTNTIYTISMRAEANAGFTVGLQSKAFAFIDPFFALGPGVDPADYVFAFSPGIGNSPATAPDPTAVPEPATGVLLLGGLATVLLRRRRAAAI
jgi:hypothetical protein